MDLRLVWQDHNKVVINIVKIICESKSILLELLWHRKITVKVKLSIVNINFYRIFLNINAWFRTNDM